MTLKEKLERWRDLRREADALAEEIKAEVMALQQTIKADGVVASYSKGRGSYDYEALAGHIGFAPEALVSYTKTVVDWRGLVERELDPLAVKAAKPQFYRPGKPRVSLKLK